MSASETKPYRGLSMEGPIAGWYARNVGKDLAPYQQLAERIARELPLGADILDLACGPGYLAIAFAALGRYRVTGLDISDSFIRIARAKAQEAGVSLKLRKGNAADMPFAETCFDAVLCRAAFKNFSRPGVALNEIYRVLKPGGFAVILDLDPDASPQAIRDAFNAMPIGAINKTITHLTFKHMLLRRARSASALTALAAASRFGSGKIQREGISLELCLRKPAG
jgi:ubiquinone/menaquinone biosynthesis C-methylase UbiE